MTENPDVLFSLTGDVRRNSRAIRQINALRELGLQVEALTLGPDAPDLWAGIRLHVMQAPTGSGPRFFASVHRIFQNAARTIRARVYHASDLFTLPAMYAAAHANGGRLVYDARELYPHVGATAGKPWAQLFWRFVEGHFAKKADAVFTVSPSIAQWMSRAYGIAEPTLIYNVPPVQEAGPSNALRKQSNISPQKVVILYQGYLKRGRGCEVLLDALRDVEGAVLVFMGEGELETKLKTLAQERDLAGRVYFVGLTSPDKLLHVTASADIGACLIEDLSLSLRYSLPNKLFEYLMAGVPVLGSNLPEIRRVIETFDVGCVVNPRDRAAIVQALRGMVSNADARRRWSANTRHVFREYDWKQSSDRFQAIYKKLTSATIS